MWSSSFPLATLVLVVAATGTSLAAVDLAALVVVPERGQSADQARRDRYECHNWAVDQTGSVPLAPAAQEDLSRDRRAERTGRILNGAAIGGTLGGLIRSVQRKHTSNGVLAGAAVGAAVAAATGERGDDEAEQIEDDYLRALSACLEGRGYQVVLPEGEE